ncbi:MAG: Ig-like domain-containing protein [Clostridia bacterium]|nr:Ig-like domain-containing protein [Clostridia bacterium]
MIKSRSKFLTILCLALVTCVCFAIGCFTLTKVNADEQTETSTVHVETILMDEGAQVRFKSAQGEHADKSGIRFTLYVNQQHYNTFTNPVVGIYVARESDLTTELDMSTPAKAPANAKHFIARSVEELSGDEAETIQDTYSLKGVLYGAPEEEYGEKLVANGYIKEADADISTVNFQGEAQTRSIAQVASAILANGSETDASNISDLKEYVDKFTAVQANFTMDTAVRTDMYKTAEPTLNVQNPAGLVATWDSSNKEVATVDADGNITRVGKGETDITATVGNKTITSKLTIGDPVPLIVDENTYSDYVNGDVPNKFIGAEELAELSIAGDYAGNATQFMIKGKVTNAGYRIKVPYTEQDFDALKADYNTVTMWLSATGVLTNSFNIDTGVTTFAKLAGAGGFGVTPKWQKLSITMDQFISLVDFETGTASVLATAHWSEGTYTDDVSLYFGDMIFEYVEPTILKVNADNYTKIYNDSDGALNNARTFVTNAECVTAGITGDYTGNATKFPTVNRFNKYTNPYTVDELNSIKNDFTHVTMWWAFTSTNEGKVYLYDSGIEGVVAPGTTAYTKNTWYKWTITIDQYIQLAAANNYEYVCPMYTTGDGSGGLSAMYSTASNTNFYFGDMYFEYIEPIILKVTADSYTGYYNNDIPSSYISAEDLATLNIAGDYTGNAVRFNMSTYKTNGGYKIKIPYTEQELLALKSKYNTVSTYVAITGVNGGRFFVDTAASRANYIANLAGYTELSITPTWQKISITIDQLITSMNSTTAEVKNYCPLIATSGAYATYDTNVYMYFGDMIFENIAE